MKAFALLTAALLVVIGIGAGLASGLPAVPTYGPPGGEFTAAFPSTPPSTMQVCPGGRPSRCQPGRSVVQYDSPPLQSAHYSANVFRTTVQVGSGDSFSVVVNAWRKFLRVFGGSGRISSITVGGSLQAARWLIPCLHLSHEQCSGNEVVTNGSVTWVANAVGTKRAEVSAFLDSFRPIPS